MSHQVLSSSALSLSPLSFVSRPDAFHWLWFAHGWAWAHWDCVCAGLCLRVRCVSKKGSILTQHVVCLHEKVHRGFSIFLPTQHVAFSAYPFSHGLQMQITHHQINSLLPTKATFTLASKVAQTRFLHLCVNRLYPLKLDPCGLFHTRINNLI